MNHIDSGKKCLVVHYKGTKNGYREGDIIPSCIKCSTCKQYIRPEEMNKECKGEKTNTKHSIFSSDRRGYSCTFSYRGPYRVAKKGNRSSSTKEVPVNKGNWNE